MEGGWVGVGGIGGGRVGRRDWWREVMWVDGGRRTEGKMEIGMECGRAGSWEGGGMEIIKVRIKRMMDG